MGRNSTFLNSGVASLRLSTDIESRKPDVPTRSSVYITDMILRRTILYIPRAQEGSWSPTPTESEGP